MEALLITAFKPPLNAKTEKLQGALRIFQPLVPKEDSTNDRLKKIEAQLSLLVGRKK